VKSWAELYWIPLGAGGNVVRFNGRLYEAMAAARDRRPRADLYHAALVVQSDARYTIEIAPSPDADEASRGVVATGAVGTRWAGRLRLFRYEVRCWRGGSIPDLRYAVGGARRVVADEAAAHRILTAVREVPTPVWGRDELGAGEMWNSNSLIAWLVATAGVPTEPLQPPVNGRAPGWSAGLEVARWADARIAAANRRRSRRPTARKWPSLRARAPRRDAMAGASAPASTGTSAAPQKGALPRTSDLLRVIVAQSRSGAPRSGMSAMWIPSLSTQASRVPSGDHTGQPKSSDGAAAVWK